MTPREANLSERLADADVSIRKVLRLCGHLAANVALTCVIVWAVTR